MNKKSHNPNLAKNSDIYKNEDEQALKTVSNNYELMTEEELLKFLRIPEISKSNNHHNVIEHLKRYRDLPRIHICNKALYPKKAIMEWVEKETSS